VIMTSRSIQPGIPTYPDLAGKVAVVTGSSRGIGAATCRLLAANGVKVVVNGRDQAALEDTVDAIRRGGGDATGIAADVTDSDSVDHLREETESTYGPVAILGAFVGSGGPPPGPTTEITPEDWRAAIEGNLTVSFLTLKSFLPGMIERGRGSIITMASTAARLASGDPIGAPTGYATAKAGVVRLTQEVAKELARHGVRVNCVSPSTTVRGSLASGPSGSPLLSWSREGRLVWSFVYPPSEAVRARVVAGDQSDRHACSGAARERRRRALGSRGLHRLPRPDPDPAAVGISSTCSASTASTTTSTDRIVLCA
jgi:3-oxoacyl-[acyl-carrier protein] reductase